MRDNKITVRDTNENNDNGRQLQWEITMRIMIMGDNYSER